jgi:Protein of unknown function (DUF3253)
MSETQLETILLSLISERGLDKTICPSEAAIVVAGKEGQAWGALMPQIRKIAVRLANEGRIVVTRKGKPVDPNDFKGVYRLGMTRLD